MHNLNRDTILPKLPESEDDNARFQQESVQEAEEVRKAAADDIEHLYIYTQPSYVDLKVKRASNSMATVEWDALLIGDTYHKDPDGFTKTLDITSDLDTGGEAVSTWYYIWAIATEDGRASCIFSEDHSGLTLPTNYIHKRLVSMARNDAAGNFQPFVQQDEVYSWDRWNPWANSGYLVLDNGMALAWATVDMTSYMPEKSHVAFMNYWSRGGAAWIYLRTQVHSSYLYHLGYLQSDASFWSNLQTFNREFDYYRDLARGFNAWITGFKVDLS